MAYSIDEIIRLMNEASRLHLKKVTMVSEDGQKIEIRGQDMGRPEDGAYAAPSAVSNTEISAAQENEKTVVTSPMVGIFYAAPGPDASPFVSVGDEVKKGQVLCIVEAMKLMNEIESEFNGRIVKVLVENGTMVEYGQPLFEMEASDGTEH